MIPVYKPTLDGNEAVYVNECIRSGWISSKGEYVSRFESDFARYTGGNYASSVSNGTVGLHLALSALNIGVGDEVILPSLTYVASANAVSYVGATPVFADSLSDTWQADPQHVRELISPRTKAVMAVHLYGHAAPTEQYSRICKDYNLYLIEDCAEALGTLIQGEHVGVRADAAVFSFYGNKTVTTGEGGMVVTRDAQVHERVMLLKNQGVSREIQYWHDVVGFNYRMTNICAAIGVAQLERLGEFLEKKREIADFYRKQLIGLPVTFQFSRPCDVSSNWMVSILAQDPDERATLREYLHANSIETRPLFFPVHTLPMYRRDEFSLPVCESLGSRGINLPSWPGLSEANLQHIANTVRQFYEGA
jgi:perosamine synthetase